MGIAAMSPVWVNAQTTSTVSRQSVRAFANVLDGAIIGISCREMVGSLPHALSSSSRYLSNGKKREF